MVNAIFHKKSFRRSGIRLGQVVYFRMPQKLQIIIWAVLGVVNLYFLTVCITNYTSFCYIMISRSKKSLRQQIQHNEMVFYRFVG